MSACGRTHTRQELQQAHLPLPFAWVFFCAWAFFLWALVCACYAGTRSPLLRPPRSRIRNRCPGAHTPAPGAWSVCLSRSLPSLFLLVLSPYVLIVLLWVVPLGAPAPLPVHSCCHLGQWSVPEHTRDVATAAGEIYTSPDRSAHSQACTCKEATKGLAFEWRQQYVYT